MGLGPSRTLPPLCAARIRLFHIADDRLPAIVYVNVLDAYKLLFTGAPAADFSVARGNQPREQILRLGFRRAATLGQQLVDFDVELIENP